MYSTVKAIEVECIDSIEIKAGEITKRNSKL